MPDQPLPARSGGGGTRRTRGARGVSQRAAASRIALLLGLALAAGCSFAPQYTRPAAFMGWSVPDILLSGNHGEVDRWRRRQAILRTARRRPDLLVQASLTPEERRWLEEEAAGTTTNEENG